MTATGEPKLLAQAPDGDGVPSATVGRSVWLRRPAGAILTEERADVLTAYQENGVNGDPDHIQVNPVGCGPVNWPGRRRAT